MLHRSLRLKWISEDKGYGLFASEPIPQGTITFVNDLLDVIIDSKDPRFHQEPYAAMLEKYAYSDPSGQKVLCWDFGKYMNHCCEANSMTTGYGFDIALTDIATDEEVTTDYGVFTIRHEMKMSCDKKTCRKLLNITDFDACVPKWDQKIMQALNFVNQVPQPLWNLLDSKTLKDLAEYLRDKNKYKSIAIQKPMA